MAYHRLYKFSLFLFLGFFSVECVNGQTTFIVDGIPESTPIDDNIYISGDFEGWTGGQEAFQLKKDKGHYFINFPKSDKTIQYKFTRGNWKTVEVSDDGKQLDNRTYSFIEKKDSVFIQIQNWDDFNEGQSSATENVHLVSTSFKMSSLDKERTIYMYLPSTYKNSTKRYPVLYMQDGQNLFDQLRSYSGEWEVDETLDKLALSMGLEVIIVGVDHGGSERIDEYTPWPLKNHPSKQQGDAYVQFLVNHLKPFIDKEYRTLNDRTNTAIMGSSLGGLISLYAVLKHPETFGMAGVFSPSLELVTSDEFVAKNSNLKESRVYFLAGSMESKHMVSRMSETVEIMNSSGFPSENIESKEVEGGQHNEKLWREEFEEAVVWLFKK